MRSFEYIAVDKGGKPVSGVIEADSEKSARSELRASSLMPSSIREVKNAKKVDATRDKGLKVSHIAIPTRQLSALLSSGHTVEASLKIVSNNSSNRKVSSVFSKLRSGIIEGKTFSQCIEDTGLFPNIFYASISAGEKSGNLDIVLEQLANHLESQQKLRRMLVNSLTYPVILVAVALLVTAMMIIFVVPEFQSVFEGLDHELPSSTLMLIGLSDFMGAYWLQIVISIAAVIYLMRRLLNNKKIKEKLHSVLMRAPIVGSILVGSDASKFFRTMGMLTSSGVPVVEAIKISQRSIYLTPLEKEVKHVCDEVSRGASFSYEISKTSFPSIALQLIAGGKGSSGLSTMLRKSAETIDEVMKAKLETMTNAFEPVLILLIGGVVLFIVGSLMSPIFDINDAILGK